MKSTGSKNKKRNIALSSEQKKRAKRKSFAAMVSSFKTEGVTFSPKQIKELRSRVKLSK